MAMMPIEKISIANQVFDQIKNSILSGEWNPGTKLPSENELTQLFSVSRVPIREALKMLKILGLIETKQGEGTFVRQVSPENFMNSLFPLLVLDKKNMHDVLEYRQIIEVANAGLAAMNADEEDIERLELSLKKIEKSNQSTEELSADDLEFHLNIALATKNNLIIAVTRIISDIFLEYYKRIVNVMGIQKAIKYHTEIFEAIRDQNPELARVKMSEHIGVTIKEVMESYKDYQGK